MENNESICRICLQKESDMIYIFDECSLYTQPIFEMIMYCASVKIEIGDGLPTFMCTLCKQRLESAYLFRQDCEQSDITLRQDRKNNFNSEIEDNSTNDLEQNLNNSNTFNVKMEIKETGPFYGNEDTNNFPKSLIKSDADNSNHEDYKPPEDDEPNENYESIVQQKHRNRRKRNLRSFANETELKSGSKSKRFVCYICCAVFNSKTDYNDHSAENHPNQFYVCEFENCDDEFKEYMQLAKHRRMVHNVLDCINCQQCQLTYRNKRSFERHIYNRHGERPFKCQRCFKLFRDNDALEIHSKVHSKRSSAGRILLGARAKVKSQRYICYVCCGVFVSEKEYKKHTAEQHPNKMYLCEFSDCKDIFKEYMELALHRKNVHNVVAYLSCMECDLSYNNKSNFDKHIYSQHGDRPYVCIQCFKMFRDSDALEGHLRTHKEYECKICNKIYTSSYRLETHLSSHSVEKPFKCEHCDKKFNDKLNLSRHDKIVHQRSKILGAIKTGLKKEKNHLCSYCGRTFDRLRYLTTHLRTHTGVKPYSCNFCSYRCRDERFLTIHIRTHTGEKPHKCRFCGKAFSTNSYLVIHERIHTGYRPYKCKTCPKDFTTCQDLKVHERTHTGVKLFHCDICDNNFTTRRYLRRHVARHNLKNDIFQYIPL